MNTEKYLRYCNVKPSENHLTGNDFIFFFFFKHTNDHKPTANAVKALMESLSVMDSEFNIIKAV